MVGTALREMRGCGGDCIGGGGAVSRHVCKIWSFCKILVTWDIICNHSVFQRDILLDQTKEIVKNGDAGGGSGSFNGGVGVEVL